ncbi:MAG: hypothetical protein IJV64_03295 [Oscillospiraceae bacterium]|nr:hypothetical protein [Oscillospiraceae bacterium]
MKLSNLERETICLFNEAESDAEIYTYNPAMQKQLAELCETHPAQVRMTQRGGSGSMSFRLPKKWLRVVPPRVLSPAQREVLERMNAKRHGG